MLLCFNTRPIGILQRTLTGVYCIRNFSGYRIFIAVRHLAIIIVVIVVFPSYNFFLKQSSQPSNKISC